MSRIFLQDLVPSQAYPADIASLRERDLESPVTIQGWSSERKLVYYDDNQMLGKDCCDTELSYGPYPL
ncbi:hypothetical protein [Exiguobacterium sp. ERU656]|uniref:hypothetical protein n=1 Tax=Exiguobacterium sp. ERU656 TaxID=2751217 RepID=UPI001BE52302|nr:hypothetical protein [Exiguobacterium sp. ERU656]